MLQRLHTDGLLRRNAGDVAAQTAAHWTWDHNATVVGELLKERASKKLLAPARKP
jgi:hypothetical protein